MKNYFDHLFSFDKTIEQALVNLNTLPDIPILFIIDRDNKLIGSLTDGDVRRGLLKGAKLNSPVLEIIQKNPKFIYEYDYDIKEIIKLRDNHYKLIPILNSNKQIIKIICFKDIHSFLPIDVLIMAGGKGQRLMPLTKSIPKPLLYVGDKPIIEHNISRLESFGVDNFWISINYLGDKIINYFNTSKYDNIKLNFIKELEPLGTIGAASIVENFTHKYILITNSDILTNLDYENFFLDFINKDADFSVVTVPYEISIPYAVVETKNQNIISLKEKPNFTYYANAGIYLLKKEVIHFIPKNKFFNATDLIEVLINKNKKIISYNFLDYWLDIGKHEDFAKAQNDIKNIKF